MPIIVHAMPHITYHIHTYITLLQKSCPKVYSSSFFVFFSLINEERMFCDFLSYVGLLVFMHILHGLPCIF